MQLIPEWFERQVERTPDAVALVFRDERLSYRELDRRSNRLAHYLRRRGIGPDVLVGLSLERSLEMVVAMMAVLKAGGAYVPLDPAAPRPRIQEMLRDCAPALLLTGENLAGLEPELELEADDPPPNSAAPDNLLNIVYTSGSTGKPKGVGIPIGAVLNRLRWMWREYPFRPGDVSLFHKSYALVAATWECFGGLLQGVPTVVLAREEVLDPELFWRRVTAQGVSYLLGTPPLLRRVLDQAERHPGEWTSLRLATTSAEPVPPSLVREWYRAFPGVPLLNLYGATECSSNVTVYDTCLLPPGATRVPIGRPFDGNEVYILDARLMPVPQGEIGEMCVSGACLARGYLNLPEHTAARFVLRPPSDGGSRMFRTGDLARLLPDGNIELVGRADNQVKVRGFRVELEDVEAALLQHGSVQGCAVSLHEDPVAGPCLAACVVAAAPIRAAELRRFLQERLPEFMIPAHFTFVAVLPLTPSGKVDRARLPSPAPSREPVRNEPHEGVESEIAFVLKEVLRLESVGRDESFLDLGLHSILMARAHGELQGRLGREFPLIDMLQHGSIASLAGHLTEGSPAADALAVGRSRAAIRLAFRRRQSAGGPT